MGHQRKGTDANRVLYKSVDEVSENTAAAYTATRTPLQAAELASELASELAYWMIWRSGDCTMRHARL
jgi:hypothetical protein